MKLKPLLILVLLLGAAASLAYWLSPGTGQANARDLPAGGHFLNPDVLDRAQRIELSGSNGEKVILEKDARETWILPDQHGMPADFEKLGRFTRSLLDAGIDRRVTSNPERLARLELGRYHLVLYDASNERLWDVEFGGPGPSGGTFFRFAGDEAAHLTKTPIHPDTRVDNWAVKRPLDFSSQDVASVTLTIPGREIPLVLEREAPAGTFSVSGDNEKNLREVKTSEVNRLLGTLLNARFTEMSHPSDPDVEAAREHAREVTLQRFDGESYTLEIGRRPALPAEEPAETTPARVEASIIFDQDGNIVELPTVENNSENDAPADGVDTEPGPVFIVYQSDDPAFPWARISQEVALQFPDRIHDALPETLDDLLEAPEEPNAEESSGD
jgi:hypothetical protein